jgi:hypothetical protein
MSYDTTYSESEREHIEELAAAYSLGALTDEADLQEFEKLVESGDSHLSKSLELMLGASAALAASVPQFTPPAALRSSLLDSINNPTNTAQNGQEPGHNAKPNSDAVRLKTRTRYFIGTSFVASLLICILVAMNVSSSAKLDRSNDLMRSLLKQTDSLRAVIGGPSAKPENDSAGPISESKNDPANSRFFSLFADPDLKLITLASMPSGSSRQHLVFSPKQKAIYFVYDNSHPIDASKTYELWATGSRGSVSLGKFAIDLKKSPPVYGFAAKLRSLPDSFSISVENDGDHALFSGSVTRE